MYGGFCSKGHLNCQLAVLVVRCLQKLNSVDIDSHRSRSALPFSMASSAIVMRLLAASVNVAKRSGSIVRTVLSSGDLGIVEKVNSSIQSIHYEDW